LKLVLR